MSITFPTTDLKVPSGITALPSGMKRPAFGTLYGFDAQQGGGGEVAFSNTYSVQFDGTNDYASIPADSAINFSGDMTLSLWVKFDTVANYDSLVCVRPTSSSLMFNLMMSGGTPKFQMYTGGVLKSTTQPTTGTWYHVAVTIESGVTNGAKMYVNGTHETTGTLTVTSATGPLEFAGLKSAYNSYYFPGYLDEVALFNSELSASDITDIYNSGSPDDISSLSPVGWWRMGDDDAGTGSTISDQGSGGNDATLYNSPTFSTDVPS